MDLEVVAKNVRKNLLQMIYEAKSGHPAGSLSVTEILVALFFGSLEEKDIFVLSNGHVCPALYAVWIEKGLLDKNEINTYAKLGSKLQSHPERTYLPNLVTTTSGPLGCGLSQSVGIALANHLDKKENYVFCLTSDGEHDEGNHWEAVLLASKHKLNKLICFVDRNRIQIDGGTEEVLPLGDLKSKYLSFGWNALEINGHDFEEIKKAIDEAKKNTDKPTAIIANTIAGKGVSFMENKFEWHAKAPKEEQMKVALAELLNN